MTNFEWPVAWDLIPARGDDPETRAAWQRAVDAAVGVLWALSGRTYGLQAVEARPCPGGGCDGVPLAGPTWTPKLSDGRLFNTAAVGLSCGMGGEILLPGPVHRVVGYIVDGEERPLSDLVSMGDRVWRHNNGAWPSQDFSLTTVEEGTWAIRYLRGIPVPAGGEVAAAKLAIEFHGAMTGGRCQLPRRTQTVQRQGVTISMIDPSDIYASGATGLTEVDLWLRAHNPHRLTEPSVVWSPEMEVW